MKKYLCLGLVLAFLALGACSAYQYKPVPFKAAEAYPNHVRVAGAVIAAQSYEDKYVAQEAFGFDIRGAGLLPVQLIVDNQGPHTLRLLPQQTFVRDAQHNLWSLMPEDRAYQRIDEHVKTARMAGEGASSAALAGAAGGILGLAYGIITGQDVLDTTYNAAVGAAALGAVAGGMSGYNDPRARARISSDLRNRSLKDKPFKAGDIAHGFLFFPGEVKDPVLLRLKVRQEDTGEEHFLQLALSPVQLPQEPEEKKPAGRSQ